MYLYLFLQTAKVDTTVKIYLKNKDICSFFLLGRGCGDMGRAHRQIWEELWCFRLFIFFYLQFCIVSISSHTTILVKLRYTHGTRNPLRNFNLSMIIIKCSLNI